MMSCAVVMVHADSSHHHQVDYHVARVTATIDGVDLTVQ